MVERKHHPSDWRLDPRLLKKEKSFYNSWEWKIDTDNELHTCFQGRCGDSRWQHHSGCDWLHHDNGSYDVDRCGDAAQCVALLLGAGTVMASVVPQLNALGGSHLVYAVLVTLTNAFHRVRGLLFISLPHGQPRSVFRGFISVSGGWMLLRKELINGWG